MAAKCCNSLETNFISTLGLPKVVILFLLYLIGDLVEMDITENTALHRVHGYLTNDGFMVATWLPNRRGPVR